MSRNCPDDNMDHDHYFFPQCHWILLHNKKCLPNDLTTNLNTKNVFVSTLQ